MIQQAAQSTGPVHRPSPQAQSNRPAHPQETLPLPGELSLSPSIILILILILILISTVTSTTTLLTRHHVELSRRQRDRQTDRLSLFLIPRSTVDSRICKSTENRPAYGFASLLRKNSARRKGKKRKLPDSARYTCACVSHIHSPPQRIRALSSFSESTPSSLDHALTLF